ncbi:Ferric reduction oxidase 4 [Linum grandiflorum]
MRKLSIVRVILLVGFLGWLMIWVMLPTKVYQNSWDPNLSSTTFNSSYFEGQGTNLLLFTFPIMVIAALGSIYLHFQTKLENQTLQKASKRSAANPWTRVLVISPLGIVTLTELAFVAMFVALHVWSLANYLYVSFGHHHNHHGAPAWQAKFRSVSLRLGYIGNISWAFLFFPVTRGSSLLPLVGLTSESSIKYHIWLGHFSNVLFTLHAVGFVVYWAMTNQMAQMLEWSRSWVSNVAGEIAMAIAAVMWVTSLARVRRKAFELFFATHHLYIFYILFYLLHVGAAYTMMILPGIFLFAVDRCLRFLQSQNRARLVSARLLVRCGTLELTFSKCPELRYNPTSIIFINVPTISKLQWHPFTVTSNSNLQPDELSLVVKSLGDWSRKLYQQISVSSSDRLEISIEGPYGPISSDFLRHDVLVLISGGSGITPFISIIREFIFQTTSKPNLETQPQILLISAFKNSADLAILDLLLPSNGTIERFPKLNLRIEAYITRENDQPITEPTTASTDAYDCAVQTKRFNPTRSDSPISGILGPDSWIWLAGIITSSFAMFVLLLAIVTRVYIYPIDGGALEGAYHYSYFVLWDVFLACGSIFVACFVGFFVKKRSSTDVNRVNDLEMEAVEARTVVGEVETGPSQWINRVTKVHFGNRPDLKGILAGFGEPNDVGVMACGPKSIRHEVARICSSAQNLHFESISFNW